MKHIEMKEKTLTPFADGAVNALEAMGEAIKKEGAFKNPLAMKMTHAALVAIMPLLAKELDERTVGRHPKERIKAVNDIMDQSTLTIANVITSIIGTTCGDGEDLPANAAVFLRHVSLQVMAGIGMSEDKDEKSIRVDVTTPVNNVQRG